MNALIPLISRDNRYRHFVFNWLTLPYRHRITSEFYSDGYTLTLIGFHTFSIQFQRICTPTYLTFRTYSVLWSVRFVVIQINRRYTNDLKRSRRKNHLPIGCTNSFANFLVENVLGDSALFIINDIS